MKFLAKKIEIKTENIISDIVNFINKFAIKNFDFGDSVGQDGNWAKLANHILGEFNSTAALQLKMAWERDQELIRTSVIAFFSKSQTLIIVFSEFEWANFEQHILTTSKSRKKFSADFTSELNLRLKSNKAFNLNCSLSCTYNWFSAVKNQHICLWKGKFFNIIF